MNFAQKTMAVLFTAIPMLGLSADLYVDCLRGRDFYAGTSIKPKKTIQAAINSAVAGDCIVIAGGVYNENVRLSKPLTLFAHDPAVAVIDGRHAGHCLLITENAAGSVVDGLVFTHGAPTNDGNKYGGGIDCLADATIRHCVFKDNGNSSTTFAGGLHTTNRSRVSVENCLFVGNYAWASGGATLTEADSFVTFDRCTIFGNNSTDFIGNQGGIVVTHGSTGIVRNCILWGNSGMQLAAYGSWYGRDATVHVSYSCVQGGVAPNGIGHFYDDGGNISADPRFLDIARRNFWFRDNSPCWRKGHPDFFEHDGLRIHMGWWPSRQRPRPPRLEPPEPVDPPEPADPPSPPEPVEIVLDPQGGDCSADVIERNVNDTICCLPVPQRVGYNFLGWFDHADGGRRIFPEETVLASCTLYARWRECESPFFDVVGGHSGISSFVELDCRRAEGARDGRLWLNGELLASSEEEAFQWLWQPRELGRNVFVYQTGRSCTTTAVEVVGLTFAPIPEPEPPMALDESVRITPEVRSIPQGGAGKSILVTGGDWTAASSAPWIVLEATSGTASDPVAYTVTASTNVGERIGYVYVSGRVHTVVQKGRSGDVSAESLVVESEGGSASLSLDFDGRFAWDARPNADWITVRPTHGVGAGSIDCSIAPYDEVGTRAGSVTFGDRTVSVFQYGRRMKLSDVAFERDYLAHVLPVTVNALAATEWSATPNASWISVVDSDNGQGRRGASLLTLAIAENPSFRARTGTVTVGTETLTITQAGRPASACSLSIAPVETAADASGANGHFAVTATPDLPWTTESSAGWLVLLQSSASGSGNGNVFYTVSPNTSLQPRTATVVVRPADANLVPITHTVVQTAASSSLSASGHEFAAAGGTVTVDVSVPGSVAWSVSDVPSWITVLNGTSRVGSGSVTLQASPNNGVASRTATMTIAGFPFVAGQKGRDFAIDCDAFVFGTDGDIDSFTVSPDGDMAWEAVASDPWISFLWGSNAGSGQGEVVFTVAPYVGDGSLRTGTIGIGGRTVFVSQRAYDLSISPRATQVSGNAGAGEIGVSAAIGDVWRAIRTEDWITIVSGTDSGTGSGTVRFAYTDNDTGVTRTGKIVIDGEVYTLTQASRVLVPVSAQVRGHGRVDGAVSHPVGSRVSLTAVPDAGYEFRYWITDAGESMQNPLSLTIDSATSVTAVFAPLTPEFVSAESSTNGVLLAWNDLAWAAEYRIYRAPSNSIPSAPLVSLPADGAATFLDTSGDEEQPFWYWVQAVGADAETESAVPATGRKRKPVVFSPILYSGLRGASHANPATYQEGTAVSFTPPGAVEGYAFAGWNPAGITADLTGAIDVEATWTPNAYSIVYRATGGTGEMEPTDCFYDRDALVSTNGFVRPGFEFLGWAASAGGEVLYQGGDWVRNLASAQGAVVELFAVWEDVGGVPSIIGDNGATVTGNAESGYVIRPSEGNTVVEVTLPDGLDPSLVTVEVGTAVETVKPNGVTVKVVKGESDITPWLDIPAANASGVIAVGRASVRQAVADEAMDASKGMSFEVRDGLPVLTTAATKPGLTYTLVEGATLDTMGDSATKQGDGQPWTPTITVKGGESGFYRIKVGK